MVATVVSRFFLPPTCGVCGGPADVVDLCAPCAAELPWNHHACRRCGEPLARASTAADCRVCRNHHLRFARAFAPFRYAAPLDRLILRLKSGHLATGRALGYHLAEATAVFYANLPRPDVVAPVPLDRRRMRERGFNHAARLSAAIASALDCPHAPRAIRRKPGRLTQKSPSKTLRRQNLKGAFASRVTGRHVLLVDDVYTAGATAEAAARAMGNCTVDLVTLARTPSFNR